MIVIINVFFVCVCQKTAKQNSKKWFDQQKTRTFGRGLSTNIMMDTNDNTNCRRIAIKKVSKMTYNVKTSKECQEMIKVKTESKVKKKISFKKLVRKKTKENFSNIAF